MAPPMHPLEGHSSRELSCCSIPELYLSSSSLFSILSRCNYFCGLILAWSLQHLLSRIHSFVTLNCPQHYPRTWNTVGIQANVTILGLFPGGSQPFPRYGWHLPLMRRLKLYMKNPTLGKGVGKGQSNKMLFGVWEDENLSSLCGMRPCALGTAEQGRLD